MDKDSRSAVKLCYPGLFNANVCLKAAGNSGGTEDTLHTRLNAWQRITALHGQTLARTTRGLHGKLLVNSIIDREAHLPTFFRTSIDTLPTDPRCLYW